MKKTNFIITILLITNIAFSQTKAFTQEGEKIIIYDDGTWEHASSNSSSGDLSENFIFFKDRRLPAGEKTLIHGETDSYFSSSSNETKTYITIAKDGYKTLIIFWQERELIPLYVWKGTVKLYLENNDIITLIDRNITGNNTIKSSDDSSDLNQIFAAYYLSQNDILKLKKSNLARVIYKDETEQSNQILNINSNSGTIRTQLYSVGR